MTITELLAEARSLCDADSTSYPDTPLLRRLNAAYEEIVGKLIAKNTTWEFEDTNYTDFPLAYTTLVANQQDYTLDVSHLIIERVQVKDVNGDWHLLSPINRREIGIPMEEYMTTAALPTQYDKSGNSLILYPAPSSADCTLTDGLRVYFQRTASVFTTSDVSTGTKKPGFASPYHILLSYKASLPYCMSYKKDRVPMLMSEILRLEKELLAFESNKEKDVRKRLSNAGVAHR